MIINQIFLNQIFLKFLCVSVGWSNKQNTKHKTIDKNNRQNDQQKQSTKTIVKIKHKNL